MVPQHAHPTAPRAQTCLPAAPYPPTPASTPSPNQIPPPPGRPRRSYFDGDDGKRYQPFGQGSGERIQAEFGLPNLIKFPIVPDLSAAGDGACP
jgi:hypothetical protein